MAEQHLNVSELFYSIQGESTRAGLPCLFVRLSGCNLRCSWCDTSFAWEEEGSRTPLKEILSWTERFPGVMVELTGGEPLLQENAYLLMESLLQMQRQVLLETNGSVAIDRVPEQVSVILDLKCPDSGMDSRINWDNIAVLQQRAALGSRDEVKFVISSQEDFNWAKNVVVNKLIRSDIPVLFSPNETALPGRELAGLLLEAQLPVRLQLQLHRILWPEIDKGV